MDKAGKYVGGFVAPVPKANVEAYKQFSEKAGRVLKEHGALEYVECISEDVKPGKVTSFPQAVKLEPDEVVAFSWIVYESREERDRVMAAVMTDPRLKDMDPKSMPFDGMRMFFGGFEVLLAMLKGGSSHARRPQPGEGTPAMKVQPYLFFDGRWEEALEFYKGRSEPRCSP